MVYNNIKTFLLLSGLTCLLIWLGQLLGGTSGMQIALIMAIIINFSAYFFSDSIVLKMHNAKPLNENDYPFIYDIVDELRHKMRLPMPRLWLMRSNATNAFATGRNPRHASIALTSGIIELLDEDELRGVISHELAHIQHRDILLATLAATLATAISYLVHIARYAALWGSSSSSKRRSGNPFAFVAVAILTPIAASIIQLAISRSREYAADETGAHYSEDPLALASALQRLDDHTQSQRATGYATGNESSASLFIVAPFSRASLSRLFSTHPPITARIQRLNDLYNKRFYSHR